MTHAPGGADTSDGTGKGAPERPPSRRLHRSAALLSPAIALAIVLLAAQLLILAAGESPARVLLALLAGTWGSAYGIGQVLFKATPLILTGLAVALPFRAGLFNVGAEGQATLGALAIAAVGTSLPADTPALLAVPVAASAGLLVGASWAALPGWLKARFGAHEVLTTIMLNFIAFSLASYTVATFLHVPQTLHTPPVVEGAMVVRLGSLAGAFRGSAANASFLVALAAAALLQGLLARTAFGLDLRAAGLNPRAARCSGIRVSRVAVTAMAIGGGCAGLVGLNFVQGYKGFYEDGFAGGVGFMGIAVALLGRNHPLWIVPAALLFGTLSQGGLAINALVPKEVVEVLQAVTILAIVAASSEVRRVLSRQGG